MKLRLITGSLLILAVIAGTSLVTGLGHFQSLPVEARPEPTFSASITLIDDIGEDCQRFTTTAAWSDAVVFSITSQFFPDQLNFSPITQTIQRNRREGSRSIGHISAISFTNVSFNSKFKDQHGQVIREVSSSTLCAT